MEKGEKDQRNENEKERKREGIDVGTGNESHGERGVNTRHRARNAYHTTSPFEISAEKERK